MKKKYLLLISILVVCCMLGGCKKKKDAEKDSVSEEPTIITKDDSVSDQVVEMQQGSNIDKSKITNIMGTQTATASDVVITNLTGDDVSAFYARPSGEEEWGNDYVEGKFTLKNNDRALFYYEKNTEGGTAVTKYDLRVSFTDETMDDCFFRELTLSDIQELSLNVEDGVPYVKYQSLSTKQQVSTLSEARKRMGLPESSSSGNSAGSAGGQTSTGTSRPNANTNSNANSNVNGNTGAGTDASATDPSQSQPSDTDPSTTVPSDTDPGNTPDPGGNDGNGGEGGGDVIPPGLDDGQGDDMRGTAQGYVGQDMDNLVGEIGPANATEDGTDEATGNTIHYHYYDGFAVSTTEDADGNQTVTGIW